MKILHVVETLSPRYGGPARLLPELAAAQSSVGHEVEIVTTNADYPRGTYHVPGCCTLTACKVLVRYFTVQFNPLKVSCGLMSYLRGSISRFDVVHVHGLYRFPLTYAAWQARKRCAPCVITPHGSLDPFMYAQSSRSVLLKRIYERWFDLPNLNGAGSIHYTAEEERERAAFLKLRAPSFVIPNGVDWERYDKLPDCGAFRSAHQLGNVPLVLFLGRLNSKKGLDILIPAFDAVRRATPEAKLAVVGPENDDYGDMVRGWVGERGLNEAVHFIGHLESAEVMQAYVDSDVFVLPSYTENFGMTVVESMACGLPVVISDQVNIHREVVHAEAGVVTRCDAEEVARALTGLLLDPSRRHSMGEAGRRLVKERYTWPPIVEALTREYEKVIERSRQKNTRDIPVDIGA